MDNTLNKVPVTAIVHTLNEENNLDRCLKALHWVQDFFVVDSGSTDKTLEIARRFTENVVVRQGNRGTLVEQRNWALDTLPIATEWVLVVDADEVFPPDLIEEIAAILRDPPGNIDGYWVRFKNIFMGRWIKHASLYPTWTIRLFRRGVIRYEKRAVNAHIFLPKKREGFLKGHFLHEDLDGVSAWIERLPEFARLESVEYEKVQADPKAGGLSFKVPDSPFLRRRWLKNHFIRLPFRPLVMFFGLYIGRGGFLDGYPGFVFCVFRGLQEWFLNLYIWERKYKARLVPQDAE